MGSTSGSPEITEKSNAIASDTRNRSSLLSMGRPKKSCAPSPVQKIAEGKKRKYRRGDQLSPRKKDGVRRPLYDINEKKVSIRKVAKGGIDYLTSSFTGDFLEQWTLTKVWDMILYSVQRKKKLWRYGRNGPCEFLDFVKGIVDKEKRKTPFKDGRPGFGWYVAFKNRNSHIITTKPPFFVYP